MTIDYEIKKIGIIGAGPGGLVALNEFLHTSKDGTSTITEPTYKNPLPKDPAFEEIVVFERADGVGGVWRHTNQTDSNLPETVAEYLDPNALRPKIEPPDETTLKGHGPQDPFKRDIVSRAVKERLLYDKSPIYNDLFTNVPADFMRFSSGYDLVDHVSEKAKNELHPFMRHEKILQYLESYAKANDLHKHIRFNSAVEKVRKVGKKWIISVLNLSDGKENWYEEEFDAVLVATGRFNVPYFPYIENLDKFNKEHPGVVLHTKTVRDSERFRGKKVLLVGGGVSALDLLQYFIPKCSEVWHSTNRSSLDEPPTKPKYGGKKESWSDEIICDRSLPTVEVPRIKKFEGETVIFENGQSEKGFDHIIFATGYHLHFPFLEGEGHVNVVGGKNLPQNKADNLYLYGFTISDPTLAHVGLILSPFFFLTAESTSVALAGVWSGASRLPSQKEQREWLDQRADREGATFQAFDFNAIIPYIRRAYEFGPHNRFDLVQLVKDYDALPGKKILKELFYKFVGHKAPGTTD